ncbi:inositol monophosphatase family protein [Nocardia brasiliensis]|uniref:Histidinol-phosphate phosphatase n=1 Tax=Nocardia brasiliensis (strain ATCC 700358 / HUJEG-1) TaxID=1133849 RepID=K0F568_NOCB7|nr:inositol monophosphatase family protein [Nocardia brasiliensis]AFU02681.1 histidinol-phosphate phosphatase [Nocardia brasiliensis ATCC 700358]OCF85640.1 hypothetical protein AW168_35875 [Nocardia brasiliensis]
MTSPAPTELTAFAKSLISIAHTEIRLCYLELLAVLRADPAVGEQLRGSGGYSPVQAGAEYYEMVTDTKQQAARLMRNAIRRRYPSHTVIGEEVPGQRGANGWTWSIDPLDGTSAMVRSAMRRAYGLPALRTDPAFGITVGLLHSDAAMLGAIGELLPRADDLVLGRGWLGGRDTPVICNGIPIPAWPTWSVRHPDSAVLACTAPKVMFAPGDQWDSFQALAATAAEVVLDQNCLGYMGLLNGSIDVVYERGLPVAHAAAVVPILEGAGVVATNQHGCPISFEVAARGRKYVLLAARRPLHQRAVVLTSTSASGADDRSGQEESAPLGKK